MRGQLPHHTLHNGAFMTKVKLKKNNNNQSAMNGLRMHHFVSVFHKKKKKTGEDPPPSHAKGKEKLLPYHVYQRLEL